MSVCEERHELGGALFIAEAEAGIESSPEFYRALPVMNGLSERGERRRRSRGSCRRAAPSTGAWYATSTGARAHCCVGRAVPVLAAASSSVGERQGAVKGAQTKMVAQFGKVLQRGRRARAK